MKPQSLAQPTEERIPERRSQLLGPFRFRDFRLLWMGLLVSNLGTWMQFTAMGYLVVHIAPTAAAAALNVGLLGASQSIPALLLSPIAGVVADRYPRRRVLLFTNSTVSLVAAALAVLTLTQHGALWALLVLNGVRAGAQAFDSPARQSWVPLLVPREFVANAIGVNSIAFNAPSIIGPPIAGVIILTIGIWAAFVINAVSTLAVVAALIFMHPVPPSSTGREPVFASIRAGLAFLFAHPVLNSVIWLLLITCIFVRPYNTLLPAYAAHVVNVDARGLGILLASGGLGAILGSIATALIGNRRRAAVWFASAVVMALGTIALGEIRSFALAMVALFAIGMAALSFAGSTNVLIQMLSPDEMRGRAISVFTMVIIGLVPAGSLLLGVVAAAIGLPKTFAGSGVVALASAIVIYASNRALRAV